MKILGRFFVLGFGLALASCGGDDDPVPTISGKCSAIAPPSATVTIANTGRKLAPLGRMTTVGNFPTGGRLTPDGRFYWSVSAGHGENDVQIVNVATGAVAQVLPLPGTYGQMTFFDDKANSRLVAYVSGTPLGNSRRGPAEAKTTIGNDGDVIHVFDVDVATGLATERATPLALPATSGGSGRNDGFPPSTTPLPNGPAGLAVTPDGKTLVVALYNADQVAIIDTATGTSSAVAVGRYPYAVGFERKGKYAYVTNAQDGTVSKLDITTKSVSATISVVGNAPDSNNTNAQPQYVLADPARDLVYVAVTNFDGVAIVDTQTDALTKFVSLKRAEGYGSQPVALALAPDDNTLYVANAGENAVAAIALTDRADGSHKQYDVMGKIPTADYTSDVQVTPDGCTLVWQTARGVATGPNVNYTSSHGYPAVNNDTSGAVSPYPSYGMDMQIGTVGVTPLPTDFGFAQLTPVVDAAQAPDNRRPAPANTPVVNASGGPSDQIKYVFYLVKENRTYDQLYGSDPRGNGDPGLEVLEDNCLPANTAFNSVGVDRTTFFGCGTTPNQHKLTRDFVLLDNFYEDSEESFNGHEIANGAYSTNYSLKTVAQLYSNRGRNDNQVGVFPVTFPPKYFLFDQAATQGITFRNYGELSGGTAPNYSDDGRATYQQVLANSDTVHYASNIYNGCVNNSGAPNTPDCAFDCGMGCNLPAPGSGQIGAPLALSRIDAFNETFSAQAASCTDANAGTSSCGVPRFNYLIMMSDHTNGVSAGARDPLSMVADNDLGVGQLVQIISSKPAIWNHAVIFVTEDDSQDGADHVDAHRAPALVLGPYVKHDGSVVHTRYDQYSVIRTIELILGMQPLSVFDAVATPMYDVFTPTPATNYTYMAIQPEYGLFKTCGANNPCVTGDGSTTKVASAADLQLAAANAKLSAALPYGQVDRVPQAINDRLLWQRVYGTSRPVPPPGPNASRLEHARAVEAMRLWERYSFFAPLARERLYAFLAETDDD